MSRPWALEKELNLPDILTYRSLEEMDNAIARIEQDLLNLRLYSSVRTEKALLEESETYRSYSLTIFLEDSWTFVPLVYPKYDTNTDLTMESKILYSNFFGTLMEFEIDSYIQVSPEEDIEGVDTGLWQVDTTLENIHLGNRTYGFQWIQQHNREIKTNTEKTVENYSYNETILSFGTDFPLNKNLTYTIAPIANMRYSYKNSLGDHGDPPREEPFSFGLVQNLVYDPYDWHGNFREGINCDLGVLFRYSFREEEMKGFSYIETAWYHSLHRQLGVNFRSVLATSYNEEKSGLGIYMRGVPDENFYGNSCFVLNSAAALKTLDWDNLFELQWEPFMDFGLSKRERESFSADQDFRMSTGFSFLFFFDKLTSIQVRTTFGWDLLVPSPEDDRFEFLLSTSLFY